MNFRVYAIWIVESIWQGVILFFFASYSMEQAVFHHGRALTNEHYSMIMCNILIHAI